jgi:hypothetical protein
MARPSDLLTDIAAGVANAQQLEADAEIARLRSEVASLKARYKASLGQIDRERERADAIAGLTGIKPAKPPAAKARSKQHDATAIVVLSDWHIEEQVGEEVGDLNRYDLDIADRRVGELVERMTALVEHERHLVKIDRIVIAALGDFLTGHIHEDCVETTQLPPLAAMRYAAERLRLVIDRAADLAREVIVVTQPGNHGRSNAGRPRMATEHDHSFEQNAYLVMAAGEKRKNVRWDVAVSYLGYLNLEGFVVRYHHGHQIGRFQGGVGGITIPANKAIAQWNRSRRADIDIFGHWHQWGWLRGRYVSNGSLIGMNAFGLRIRAEMEAPCQSFLVVDHQRRDITRAMPIFCDRDLQAAKC